MKRVLLILIIFMLMPCLSKAIDMEESVIESVADVNPEFPGGIDSLYTFVRNYIEYPFCAFEHFRYTEFIIELIVLENGDVIDKTDYSKYSECEISAFTRFMELMPSWKPAIKDGLYVKSFVSMNFIFKIITAQSREIENIDADYLFYIFGDYDEFRESKKLDLSESDPEVVVVVEQNPEFPGGMDSLFSYLARNINYPIEAQRKKVSGRVVVRFVVDEVGDIYDVVVVLDIGEGCGEEAVRVVNEMPRWKPGYQRGKPVKAYYSLPIKFTLE